MPHHRLFVFGPPPLESAGQPADLGLRKALALLVYLTVRRRPHSRDALATMFWPEHDQSDGWIGSSASTRTYAPPWAGARPGRKGLRWGRH
jgi:hypothetical protein